MRAATWWLIARCPPMPSWCLRAIGRDSRLNRGLQALKTGLGRELVARCRRPRLVFGKTLAQIAQAYIQTLPPELAAHIHVCPITARSTVAESADAARCLAPLHPHRVLIVTSDYHTRRALSVFQRRAAAIRVVGRSGARRNRVPAGLLEQSGMAQDNAAGMAETCLTGKSWSAGRAQSRVLASQQAPSPRCSFRRNSVVAQGISPAINGLPPECHALSR